MDRIQKYKFIFWNNYYLVRNWTILYYKKVILFLITIIIVLVCALLLKYGEELRKIILPFFESENQQSNLRNSLITLGATLIGTTAIIFSLVTFALQINVDRLPNGLFRKVSADKQILFLYASSFILSLSIIFISNVEIEKYIQYIVISSVVATFAIMFMLYKSYERALYIINPHNQIRLLCTTTMRSFNKLKKHADRISPLFSTSETESMTADEPRTQYFLQFSDWFSFAVQAINYANAFHKRYAEIGDYEVSKTALDAVLLINQEYIKVKGKTFYNHDEFIDNPLTSDKFINITLEMLRQNIQLALPNRDEYQIEQNLNILYSLSVAYFSIDYGKDFYITKHHAELASGYLANAIDSIIPHNMPDLLMASVRLLGRFAYLNIQYLNVDVTPMAVKRIYDIAQVAVFKNEYHPVVTTSIEQFSNVTVVLLQNNKSNSINNAVKDVCQYVTSVTTLFIQSNQFSIIDADILFGPYYSDLIAVKIPIIVEELKQNNLDKQKKELLIKHIIQWSWQIHLFNRELLLFTVKQKSNFFGMILNWVTGVIKLLISITELSSCSEEARKQLCRNAQWLIYVFDFIPQEQESLNFVEIYQIHEKLFEIGYLAYQCECESVANDTANLLLKWTFRTGLFESKMSAFECSLLASITLALEMSKEDDWLLELKRMMSEENIPDENRRTKAKEYLLNYLNEHNRRMNMYGNHEYASSKIEYNRVRDIFSKVITIICPDELHSDSI